MLRSDRMVLVLTAAVCFAVLAWVVPDDLMKAAIFISTIWAPLAALIMSVVLVYLHWKSEAFIFRLIVVPAGLLLCLGFLTLRVMELDVKWFAKAPEPVRMVDLPPTPTVVPAPPSASVSIPPPPPGTLVQTVPEPAAVVAPKKDEAKPAPVIKTKAPAPKPAAKKATKAKKKPATVAPVSAPATLMDAL